jgi:hypothetical protein
MLPPLLLAPIQSQSPAYSEKDKQKGNNAKQLFERDYDKRDHEKRDDDRRGYDDIEKRSHRDRDRDRDKHRRRDRDDRDRHHRSSDKERRHHHSKHHHSIHRSDVQDFRQEDSDDDLEDSRQEIGKHSSNWTQAVRTSHRLKANSSLPSPSSKGRNLSAGSRNSARSQPGRPGFGDRRLSGRSSEDGDGVFAINMGTGRSNGTNRSEDNFATDLYAAIESMV